MDTIIRIGEYQNPKIIMLYYSLHNIKAYYLQERRIRAEMFSLCVLIAE